MRWPGRVGEGCGPGASGRTGTTVLTRPAVREVMCVYWEALGSVVLGLALAWAALHWLADRLPSRSAVLVTGVLGALFGALVTHSALGPGQLPGTLAGAAAISAVLLSLLIKPASRRLRRRAAARPATAPPETAPTC